jgi:hypothetical protein
MASADFGMRNEKINPILVDPKNRLLWHYPIRRLDASQIHDAALAASGELDEKAGGAGVDLAKTPRRAVYGTVLRNKPAEMMNAFDSPDAISHAPSRNVTTTATQSLLMLNGEWILARADAFACRLVCVEEDESARVKLAYRLAFGRPPTTGELTTALNFIRESELENFCHALLNANEFVYLD